MRSGNSPVAVPARADLPNHRRLVAGVPSEPAVRTSRSQIASDPEIAAVRSECPRMLLRRTGLRPEIAGVR
eukprot:4632913-Alexandrium_andersonii.AAC.1